MTILRKIRFHPRAWEDVQESAYYLANEGSGQIAERFLDSVDELTRKLAMLPQMGAPCRFRNPLLRGVRRLPVTGFRKWMIFYQETKDGVEVIRVLHGARDIASILNRDVPRL